ncbi:MAG: hypothetical protein JSW61_12170 [Candidatus Thorarchaeota archaeon]|nr:MAG: hypothetical protein JSW61_12170 [Candidatus Thorarchaeota archaeon]
MDGIVVKASIDLVREAAQTVISDFTEVIESGNGRLAEEDSSLREGDYVVFRENMDICPAMIIATKLGDELWYVITTAECPPSKCDDRQAMKCTRLNDQNLRIFRNFVTPRVGSEIITEWKSRVTDESRMQMIIDRVTERWAY